MLIVQTTIRKGVSYLEGTLSSIQVCGDVGTREKILVSDGPLPADFVRPDGWDVVEHPWRGARATGWACMATALAAGASDLILLQDDVVVCEDGGPVMDRCPVPDDCIATTFFTSGGLPGLQPKNPGAARFIVLAASGTGQALKLPRRSLEYLCDKDYRNAPNHIRDVPHQFDDSLFAFARESPWAHVAHLLPNIVRHVGEVSACGTSRKPMSPWSVRRGETFPGNIENLPIFKRPYQHPSKV